MSKFKVEDLTLEEAQKIIDDAPIGAVKLLTTGSKWKHNPKSDRYVNKGGFCEQHSSWPITDQGELAFVVKYHLSDVKAHIERLKKHPKKHATVKDLTLEQAKEIILNADWRDTYYCPAPIFIDNEHYSDMSEARAEIMIKDNVNLLRIKDIHARVYELSGGKSEEKGNPKYDVTIHGKYGTGSCTVDVYRVLDACPVTNPQLQHLVKKALFTGDRGHKTMEQDLIDIRDSAQSALDMFYSKKGE